MTNSSNHIDIWLRGVGHRFEDVVVLDQAKYHRRVTDDTRNPTTAWRKRQIIDWLKKQNVPVPDDAYIDEFTDMTVAELRNLAKKYPIKKKFVVERIVEESGKDVKILWLPVAHCELNPIELVWSNVKSKTTKFDDLRY